MARPSYGTFNEVTDNDGRSLGLWLIWGIGLTCASFFAWVGIAVGEWGYTAASIIGGVVWLLLGVTEASWSRCLVSIVSTSDGTIVVRPGGAVMFLRVLTALLAGAAGVLILCAYLKCGSRHQGFCSR